MMKKQHNVSAVISFVAIIWLCIIDNKKKESVKIVETYYLYYITSKANLHTLNIL